MKRIILAATIALSAVSVSAVFADAQVTSDCHHKALKMESKHCKSMEKGSAARKACVKNAKAHKNACHISRKHQQQPPATQNHTTQLTTGTATTPAIAPQPAPAQ